MYRILIVFLFALTASSVQAAENAPWGTGNVVDIKYNPQKVVYDVAVSSVGELEHVLDRASYLSKVYKADPFAASIVIVLHGNEIPFFATQNYNEHKELMRRAQSLTYDEVIEFRMCKIAAQGHGFKPKDIHAFVKIVPMADAEIIRLQTEEGHAYMR